jgi:regulator of replication initiation timing
MKLLRTRAVTRRCANCNGSFVFIKHGERCAECLEKAGDPQAERIAWLENQLYTMLSNFEDQIIEGQDIISDSIKLEKENAKLKEKLSEFQEGLPIEKAKTDQGFFLLKIKGLTVGNKTYLQEHFRVMHFNELGWFDPIATGGEVEDAQIIKIFRLPSLSSETQEGK